jgi:glucose/arabinose dehydrogenase
MSTGGEVANALVCKTSIRGFNSRPVLQTIRMPKIAAMFVYLAVLPSVLAGQSGAPLPSSDHPQVPADRQPDSAPKTRFRPRGPVYATTEGQPIDARLPEKSDDKPLFPEQTRAPFHATAPFTITTLASTLHAPWSLAFLSDGKILITEKLPGAMRILDKQGVLSAPIAGLSAVSSVPEFGGANNYRFRGSDRSRSVPASCLVSRMICPVCNCR